MASFWAVKCLRREADGDMPPSWEYASFWLEFQHLRNLTRCHEYTLPLTDSRFETLWNGRLASGPAELCHDQRSICRLHVIGASEHQCHLLLGTR